MYKLNHVLARIKPVIFPVEQQEKGQQIHINPGQLIFNSRPSLTDVFLNKLMFSLEKPSQTISEQMVTLHKSRWALSDMTQLSKENLNCCLENLYLSCIQPLERLMLIERRTHRKNYEQHLPLFILHAYFLSFI